MSSIILAMREPYLSQLLDGSKTVEVRKTRPACGVLPHETLYLYRKGAIHGQVSVREMHYVGRTDFEMGACEAIAKFAEKACLEDGEMLDYLGWHPKHAAVYEVYAPIRYARPVPVPCRPQSWQYMTDSILELLPDGREGEE